MHAIRLVNLGQVPSWQTQAYYHAVAELMDASTADTIILCQPTTPYLCLGYHQRLESIFDRDVCQQLGLPIYRRRVGGGGTYLDANQLFYQCIFHHSRTPRYASDLFAQMLAAPVATLQRLGINAELRAVNEIEADGYRIAGIGGGRIREASVVVGNFLIDFNYDTMAKVWAVPWEPFRSLASAALYDRITTLKSLLVSVDVHTIEEILVEEYQRSLGRILEPGRLSNKELALGEEICERISSSAYLDLHSSEPAIGAKQGLKIAAGIFVHAVETNIMGTLVQASILVKDDVIQEAHLQADMDMSEIENNLIGVPFAHWQEAIPVAQ